MQTISAPFEDGFYVGLYQIQGDMQAMIRARCFEAFGAWTPEIAV